MINNLERHFSNHGVFILQWSRKSKVMEAIK